MLIAVIILGVLLFVFLKVIAALGTKTQRSPESSSAAESSKSRITQSSKAGQVSSEASRTEAGQPGAVQETKPRVRPLSESETAEGPIKIFFDFDRANINKNVYCIFNGIEKVVQQKSSRQLRIVIEGNADSVGPKLYNINLSRRRAARVADSLSKRLGIPLKSIELVVNGSSKPVASNRTSDGRAENRRSEVHIYN